MYINEAVYRTAPATPGLLIIIFLTIQSYCWKPPGAVNPYLEERRDIRSNIPLYPKEFPRAKPEGTLEKYHGTWTMEISALNKSCSSLMRLVQQTIPSSTYPSQDQTAYSAHTVRSDCPAQVQTAWSKLGLFPAQTAKPELRLPPTQILSRP